MYIPRPERGRAERLKSITSLSTAPNVRQKEQPPSCFTLHRGVMIKVAAAFAATAISLSVRELITTNQFTSAA